MVTRNRSEKNRGHSAKLTKLAGKINDGHKRCLKALRSSLAYARETGTFLLEAKSTLDAWGQEWLPWVQENCDFSISQAQRYMRIADRYEELLDTVKDKDDLTMSDALKLLSPGKGEAKPSPKRFQVFSDAEASDRAMDAARLCFPKDSAEEKFIKEKAEALARQVIATAKRSKLTDKDDKKIEEIQVAIALIHQLKKALQLSLVVEVGESEKTPKTSANGYTPVNRLNGKVTAKAS